MNVHTIRDPTAPDSERRMHSPRRQQPRPEPNQPQGDDNGMPWNGFASPLITEQNINYAQNNRVLLVSGRQQLKNPREETYWDMLTTSFCPSWSCLSLTMLIALTQLGMFIGQAIYGINRQGALLQISSGSLIKFGASQGQLVKNGDVYRLLSAIFVHINLVHLIGNMFSTFVLVTRIEYTFQPLKTLIVYLVSGIAGNIFSLAVDPSNGAFYTLKAGASTSLHGMIGIVLGYIIINWTGLRNVGEGLRCSILCMFFFLIIFTIIFTPSNSKIDYYGHLGGFLAGIWLAAIHEPLINQTKQKVLRIVFVCLLAIQLTGTFLGFYLSH